jgi:hypothetical protein
VPFTHNWHCHCSLALLPCCAHACAHPRLCARLHGSALLRQALASATLTLSHPIHGTTSADIKGLPLPLAHTTPRQPSSSSKRCLLPCFPPLSRRRRRQLTPASALPRLHALEELPIEAYLTRPVTQHLIHRSLLVPLSPHRSRQSAALARCHLPLAQTRARDVVKRVQHRPWVIIENTFSLAGRWGRLGSRAKSRALATPPRPHVRSGARMRAPYGPTQWLPGPT